MEYPEQKIDTDWVKNGINYDTVKWAESFGKYLCDLKPDGNPGIKALTAAQLRRFFGEIKRIELYIDKNKEDIIMLKPLLAYAIGKDTRKTRIKEFGEELFKAIDFILKNDCDPVLFKNFVKILEAIVAYHKLYGGKESNN